jgi:hypothetical protein
MDPTELIERYAHEVSRHLPRKQRADVETELITLLNEMLEERAETSGRPIDEALAVDVVRVFGEPGQVAQRYGPPNQYLIGPNYYPSFMIVMKIIAVILACVFFGLSVAAILSSVDPFPNIGSILLGVIPTLFSAIVSSFGIVVIIFVVMERYAVPVIPKGPAWDPLALPEVEDPNRIDRVEIIGTLVFSSLALVLFNLFPNWLSYLVIHDGVWGGIRIFAPEFTQHVPLLNISWLLEIGLAALILRSGQWTKLTRWLKIGTTLLSGVIMYRMAVGGPLLAIPLVDSIVRGALFVALFVSVIVVGTQVYQALTGHNLSIKGIKPLSIG